MLDQNFRRIAWRSITLRRLQTVACTSLFIGLAACAPTSANNGSGQGQKASNNSTIKTFLPWNQNRKNLGRYDLGWQATPQRHPGNGISLAEILWGYTYPGRHWANYPGLDAFHLKNSSRRTEDGKQVDLRITDPKFPNFIGDIAVRQVKRFGVDGVLLDGWIDEPARRIPVAQQKAARVRIAKAIRSKVSDDFTIIGNVGWRSDTSTHRYLNGAYVELFKKATRRYTSSQIREIESLMMLHDSRLREPRIVAIETWRVNTGSRRRDAATNLRFARLFAAMTAVVPRNGYFIYADNNSDSSLHDHDHVYYDFYDIDLGGPIGGAVRVKDGVKYKRYRDGLIAFNRTKRRASISISGLPNITIEGETGIFCRINQSRVDCDI
ncbi:MAG: putative glycoside hydrolase [Paracoccaceae bacterium]